MLEVSFTPYPKLETERLVLRAITEDDAPSVFAQRSDPRLMKHLERPRASSIDEAYAVINTMRQNVVENLGITWAMALKEKPSQLIGTIGFWRIDKDHHRAEIGYMMAYDYHGKGLMSEAMGRVLRYAFEDMKVHSVEANVNPKNDESIRLLERHGFVREAYFKENYYYDGKFFDSVILSLLNPHQKQTS